MKTTRTHSIAESQVDLNPLLDVVFILLIFFILLASFSKENTLPIIVQSKASQQTSTTTTLLLNIDSQDRIHHCEREISPAALRSYIARMKAEASDDLVVLIQMHPDASVNAYTQAVDAARLAQVAVIANRVKAAS